MSYQDWMTALQAVILFLGLAATALTLWVHHKEAKRLATIHLIIHQRSDEKLNKAVDLMGKLARAQKDFSDLSEYFKDLESPESRAIIMVLNFREFVSVGINSGSIDEETYKRSYYSIMLRDWKYLKKTIEAIRASKNGRNTNFQEFEKVASRWSKHPLKPFN